MQQGYQQNPVMQQPGQMPMAGMQQPGMQMQQPGNGEQWMPMPQGISGVPAGLEYLTQVDQLLVKQKIEIFEMVTGMETANKYKVKNSMGQDIYKAEEHSDFCSRQCCGPLRKFNMSITDNMNRNVISIDRPLKCGNFCCPCCGLQQVTVTSPITGETLGFIKQTWSIFPRFDIQDANGTTILKIEGPLCTISCCADVAFQVLTGDGNEIGGITKQWSGIGREAFTDADNFGVKFPLDLDVKVKATLLAAVFLIDFMYFEQPPDNNN